MKKSILSFIGLITLGICLASCNYVDILAKKVKSVSLSDATSAYLVGQTYDSKCELTMSARYTNGESISLNKSDVSFFLTYQGTAYDIKSPFTVQGTYYLTVQFAGVNSNTIPVSVFSNEQYVSSINIISSENTVEETKHVTVELSVSPDLHTVPVEYEIGDPNKISIERNSEISYRIKGLLIGETTITFKAKSSASTYVTKVFNISVIPTTKVTIQQTYNNYVKRNSRRVSACPTTGDVNLLVIPVWFTDSDKFINPNKKDTVREDIRKSYFGSSSETGWHSVSSYYKEESKQLLNLTGTVTDWYSCNLSSTTVATYDPEKDDNTESLVRSAVNWYFGSNDTLRKDYDSDEDGYLDGVMLIYGAADDQSYIYSGGNMWAYCFWTGDSSNKNKPCANVFFWASYDFMYSGGESSTAKERTGYRYGNGDTRYCAIDSHTYIHEMGHVFGLEDYYDYNRINYQPVTNPAAGFSMQDHNVGGHDPYSVMALGWANPYIPESNGIININDFQSSHDIILLSPGWNVYNSPFDEYLLLELYSNTNLNKFDCDYHYRNSYAQGPQSVGIRVWHVDARLLTVNIMNTSAQFCSPDVNTGRVTHAFNNTSSAAVRESDAHYYIGGNDNQTFNILQLIRNSTAKTYTDKNILSSDDLFVSGSSFSMTNYSAQFPKGSSLDNGKELGWDFLVKSITNNGDGTYSAEIKLTRV